jgi:hypothetical protein
MFALNSRDEFSETLHELDEASETFTEHRQVMWKVEYLTRDLRHLQFYGIHRDGHRSTAGHELGDTGSFDNSVDPDDMLSIMLGFAENLEITSYLGRATNLQEIVTTLADGCIDRPELARISIEKRGQTYDGRKQVIVTNMAYLGFNSAVTARVCETLRNMPEISPHWCRERHYIPGLSPLENAIEQVVSRQ